MDLLEIINSWQKSKEEYDQKLTKIDEVVNKLFIEFDAIFDRIRSKFPEFEVNKGEKPIKSDRLWYKEYSLDNIRWILYYPRVLGRLSYPHGEFPNISRHHENFENKDDDFGAFLVLQYDDFHKEVIVCADAIISTGGKWSRWVLNNQGAIEITDKNINAFLLCVLNKSLNPKYRYSIWPEYAGTKISKKEFQETLKNNILSKDIYPRTGPYL